MIKFRIKEFVPAKEQSNTLFEDRDEAVKEMEKISENKDEHLFIIEVVEFE